MMKKDFVVSVFVFAKFEGVIHLLLLYHKKLDRWLIPGGHIEFGENPAEAATREIREETNIRDLEFVSFVHKDYSSYSDAKYVPAPEFVFEEIIQPHKTEPLHIHVDMIYVAKTYQYQDIEFNPIESNNIKWVKESDIAEMDLFDMTKTLAKKFFEKISNE